MEANRVLIPEPGHFENYPVSSKTIDFVLQLANNIPGIQLFVGEFAELVKQTDPGQLHFKEHPTNRHFVGQEHSRDWMVDDVKGYFPSFFSFWRKSEKHLEKLKVS